MRREREINEMDKNRREAIENVSLLVVVYREALIIIILNIIKK